MSPNSVLRWMRRCWYVVAAALFFLGGAVWLVSSAINASEERQASRARVESLAEKIDATTAAIEAATSPETQARNNARIAQILADLRRSIDCAELDDEGTYSACTEVAARMAAIRSGTDPFVRPTPSP